MRGTCTIFASTVQERLNRIRTISSKVESIKVSVSFKVPMNACSSPDLCVSGEACGRRLLERDLDRDASLSRSMGFGRGVSEKVATLSPRPALDLLGEMDCSRGADGGRARCDDAFASDSKFFATYVAKRFTAPSSRT